MRWLVLCIVEVSMNKIAVDSERLSSRSSFQLRDEFLELRFGGVQPKILLFSSRHFIQIDHIFIKNLDENNNILGWTPPH